jgi:hypothetical protein
LFCEGLNIMFPGLKEFMGMQVLYITVKKRRILLLIKGLERDLRGKISGKTPRELICRGGTGVMRAGGITESLRSSSSRWRGHLHQRLGPNL